MKKNAIFLFMIFCLLSFVGCANNGQDDTIEYHYHGEHEFFVISDVSYSLSETGERFNAGRLSFTMEKCDEVASYSVKYYTLRSNGERNVFHCVDVADLQEGDLQDSQPLGSSGSNSREKIINLDDGLWVELIIEERNGTESSYQIKLALMD